MSFKNNISYLEVWEFQIKLKKPSSDSQIFSTDPLKKSYFYSVKFFIKHLCIVSRPKCCFCCWHCWCCCLVRIIFAIKPIFWKLDFYNTSGTCEQMRCADLEACTLYALLSHLGSTYYASTTYLQLAIH